MEYIARENTTSVRFLVGSAKIKLVLKQHARSHRMASHSVFLRAGLIMKVKLF
jgi:hypothetical protein